ncbi:MAG TPA: GLUG motif-containing protein [Methylomusa anaerophila]|uniref:Heme/hemopexin-binding protein n=1 Tax=Methylomusa anaerophila TaxID=1930071 RepID=A0A348ALU7_9FIRM|nr:GLUG motif-containing protein [Methylomusa anaerophila]BBB92045.1 heme/hemopexin-binding protein precursor [Methylomusa anaerophila]HML87943.1 GLUG motif-containing protein [Methylomusa anaerophila]
MRIQRKLKRARRSSQTDFMPKVSQAAKQFQNGRLTTNLQPYHSLWLTRLCISVAALLLGITNYPGTIWAMPDGGQVTAGSGSISQTGNTMTINQTTPNLVINWNGFGINCGERVAFSQPTSAAVALNRVLGNNPTQIFGQLTANGKVFLTNPNGILFAPGSQINVGSLVASTLNIADQDFLTGKYTFANSNNCAAGAVVNQGQITAGGGYIALLAPEVRNEGIIVAKQGTVALGAGQKITLDTKGDGIISLAVDTGAVNAQVANKQYINAAGGMVIMTAKAAGELAGTVVNNGGLIEARSISEKNGIIRLEGGSTGRAANSGTLDASGKNAGETGGTVKILGETVTVADGAAIDVSGVSGGGTVLVGGNYQGQGTEQNATATTVAATATINADAITAGNGGKVVVWANDTTDYYGNISAKGGSVSGNGGSAEVSGKKTLLYKGRTDLRAPQGKTGTLLLDPGEYTISTDATSGNVYNADDLSNQLNSANMVLQTDGTGTGDIAVTAPVTWSSGNSLTLKANNDINVNATVKSTDTGDVVLRADSDADSSGTVTFGTNGKVVTNGAVSIYYNPGGTNTVPIDGIPTTVKDYSNSADYSAYVQNTSGNAGNVAAYMLVNNAKELQSMNLNLSGTYALGKDIDASSVSNFVPIGNEISKFQGILDGNGYRINNLTINRPITDYVGLFGSTMGAAIKDIQLLDVNITGQNFVGGLAGWNYTGSAISNSYSTGMVAAATGNGNAGGLVGCNDGSIVGSYSTSSVAGGFYVGGLVGYNRGPINASYSTGRVTGSDSDVGGLVGYNISSINDSYSTGKVTGATRIGGLIGYSAGSTVNNSYSTGTVGDDDGSSTYVGGLVGWNDNFNTIENCYSSGTVKGTMNVGGLVGNNDRDSTIETSYSAAAVTGKDYIGGLTGYNGSTINNSYSTGAVTGINDSLCVGGLVGENDGGIGNGSINNSYSTGRVTGGSGSTYVGGLVGYNYLGDISASFWDTDTSQQASSSGGTGKSTSDMQRLTTYTDWNSGTWAVIDGKTYPYLKAVSRVASGNVSGYTNNSGKTLQAVVGGTVFDSTATADDGAYYFVLPQNQTFLAFLTGSDTGAVVGAAGTTNMNDLNLEKDTLTVNANGTAMSNSILGMAKGTVAGVPYSYSGGDIILNNGVTFKTTSGTNYTLDGNITTSGSGSQIYQGPVTATKNLSLSSGGGIEMNGSVDVASDLTAIAQTGSIIVNRTVNAGTGNISLTAGADINLNSPVNTTGGVTLTGSGGANTFNIGNGIIANTGTLSINGLGGNDTLTLNDSSNNSNNYTYTITGTRVTREHNEILPVIIDYQNIENLSLKTGKNHNTVNTTLLTGIAQDLTGGNDSTNILNLNGQNAILSSTNSPLSATGYGPVTYSQFGTVNVTNYTTPATPPATDPATPPATDPATPPATDPATPPATDPATPPATDPATPPTADPTTPPITDPATPPATLQDGSGLRETIAVVKSLAIQDSGSTATEPATGISPESRQLVSIDPELLFDKGNNLRLISTPAGGQEIVEQTGITP